MTNQELINLALETRENSYSPYSGFRVGAALLCRDGRAFCGANIENASYSLTNCAERSALFAAVSAGYREFDAIAIVGGETEKVTALCPPCGACRQALAEFSKDGALRVLLYDGKNVRETTLSALLPHTFSL